MAGNLFEDKMQNTKIFKGVNRKFLDTLVQRKDLTKMNMWEVVQYIYDETYKQYGLRFLEEQELRIKYEATIIKKIEIIDQLKEQIRILQKEHDTERVDLPEETSIEVTENGIIIY